MKRTLRYSKLSPTFSLCFSPRKNLCFASSLPQKGEPKGTKESQGIHKGKVEIQAKEGQYRGLTVLEQSLPHDATIFSESLAGMKCCLHLFILKGGR
jgi:hypothetical protein